MGPGDACPFPDCLGVGLGFELFIWDDLREPEDPRWPSSPDQLRHGMRSPEMESFYREQLQARIERTVSAFEASPERVALLAGQTAHHLTGFLKVQANLAWDLTDPDEPSKEPDPSDIELVPHVARIVDPDEAPKLLAELRAFFAFAQRTQTVQGAGQWRQLLEGDDMEPMLRRAIETEAERAATASERPKWSQRLKRIKRPKRAKRGRHRR